MLFLYNYKVERSFPFRPCFILFTDTHVSFRILYNYPVILQMWCFCFLFGFPRNKIVTLFKELSSFFGSRITFCDPFLFSPKINLKDIKDVWFHRLYFCGMIYLAYFKRKYAMNKTVQLTGFLYFLIKKKNLGTWQEITVWSYPDFSLASKNCIESLSISMRHF